MKREEKKTKSKLLQITIQELQYAPTSNCNLFQYLFREKVEHFVFTFFSGPFFSGQI